MNYTDYIIKRNEEHKERLELVIERLQEIAKEPSIEAPFDSYFEEVAKYLLLLNKVVDKCLNGEEALLISDEGKEINKKLYNVFKGDNYEKSYLNPAYAISILGEDYGTILAAVYANIVYANPRAFMGDMFYLCVYSELIVELYGYILEKESDTPKLIQNCVYSFMHDYTELFAEDDVVDLVDPNFDFYLDLVMNADLSNTDYLYRYGLNISNDSFESSKFLNTLSEEDIQAMANTFTEGYRIGFSTCNKDISKKSCVQILYPLGFERMVKCAVKNFEKIGLKSILGPQYTIGVHKQFDYDYKEINALWMDKAFNEYRIECLRNAFEKNVDIAPKMGGPAVIEIFGEEPFVPQVKPENPKYSEKQQQLYVSFIGEKSAVVNKYIKGEERSFTIISYPVASIGEKYKEIFEETVRINTLDYVMYRDIQQKIIDVLDTADRVHILGKDANKTDLYVKVYELQDKEKETAFENCVADVNIPVGEVFTSPVLEGTEGKLHVTQVFLNELNYLNLEIDFKDGKISEYTCTNFENEEENKKYIKDNIMYHHDTLPMGEFAIGTNTTAYRMGKVFDIADKLPILIAEKTGPHFAVGDTCFTYDEDNITYNPDGKRIMARDNSISILRKTDKSKAYFNCHTDITIPYNELGAITVIRKDGSTCDIIRDGRFVLPGTEELNKPLDDLK